MTDNMKRILESATLNETKLTDLVKQLKNECGIEIKPANFSERTLMMIEAKPTYQKKQRLVDVATMVVQLKFELEELYKLTIEFEKVRSFLLKEYGVIKGHKAFDATSGLYFKEITGIEFQDAFYLEKERCIINI